MAIIQLLKMPSVHAFYIFDIKKAIGQ